MTSDPTQEAGLKQEPAPEQDPPPEQEKAPDDARYLYFLLLSLVFMLLVVPLFESGLVGGSLMHVGLTAVLVTAAIASRRNHGAFAVSIFIVLIAAPLSWSTRWFDDPHPALILASCLVEAAFFVAMATLILIAVVRRYLASFHAIFGAICSYLLLGLAWAMLYLGIIQLDPDSFDPPIYIDRKADRDVSELSTTIYFSFVTMSTLGYGDFKPQSGVARTISWMQAVVGQFYMAVLVAWLISEIPRRRRGESSIC